MSVWAETAWWRQAMFWGVVAAAVTVQFDSAGAGVVVVVYGWLMLLVE